MMSLHSNRKATKTHGFPSATITKTPVSMLNPGFPPSCIVSRSEGCLLHFSLTLLFTICFSPVVPSQQTKLVLPFSGIYLVRYKKRQAGSTISSSLFPLSLPSQKLTWSISSTLEGSILTSTQKKHSVLISSCIPLWC